VRVRVWVKRNVWVGLHDILQTCCLLSRSLAGRRRIDEAGGGAGFYYWDSGFFL
jgi:hypothetical protein